MAKPLFPDLAYVRRQTQQLYERKKREWLLRWLENRTFCGYSVSLEVMKTAAEDNVRAFESFIETWNQSVVGGHVEFVEKTWYRLGGQRKIPKAIHITSIAGLWHYLPEAQENEAEWDLVVERLSLLRRKYGEPVCKVFLREWYCVTAPDPQLFEQVTHTAVWLLQNRPANCFIRELPIEGVSTKWLEMHRGLVAAVVSAMAGVNIRVPEFDGYFGLRKPETLVTVRHVGELMPTINDLAVGLPIKALCELRPRAVCMVENLQTGLSLSLPDDVLIIMGCGFDVTRLGAVPWFSKVPFAYMGDLDVHGLVILANLRTIFPQVRSVLMDSETLERWKELAVFDPTKNLQNMSSHIAWTQSEADLFHRLRTENLRLEQERIPIRIINRAFEEMLQAQENPR